jgi:mRNA-degrading endonuclease RelE of RelBE toxin-antitoxin system
MPQGVHMKLILVFLTFVLFTFTAALAAQDTSKPSSDQPASQNQNQTSSKTDQNMSGTVSQNGKKFTNDKDNKTYSVNNPDTLKGHEGEHVGLIIQVDPDNNVIHVIQVEAPQQ